MLNLREEVEAVEEEVAMIDQKQETIRSEKLERSETLVMIEGVEEEREQIDNQSQLIKLHGSGDTEMRQGHPTKEKYSAKMKQFHRCLRM